MQEQNYEQRIEKLERIMKEIQEELINLKLEKEDKEKNKKNINFFEWYKENETSYFLTDSEIIVPQGYNFDGFSTFKEREEAYKKFISERIIKYEAEKLNAGWKPDWNNNNPDKYYLMYSSYEKKYLYENTICSNRGFPLCLESRDKAMQLIEILKEYTDKKYPVLDWYFQIEGEIK